MSNYKVGQKFDVIVESIDKNGKAKFRVLKESEIPINPQYYSREANPEKLEKAMKDLIWILRNEVLHDHAVYYRNPSTVKFAAPNISDLIYELEGFVKNIPELKKQQDEDEEYALGTQERWERSHRNANAEKAKNDEVKGDEDKFDPLLGLHKPY